MCINMNQLWASAMGLDIVHTRAHASSRFAKCQFWYIFKSKKWWLLVDCCVLAHISIVLMCANPFANIYSELIVNVFHSLTHSVSFSIDYFIGLVVNQQLLMHIHRVLFIHINSKIFADNDMLEWPLRRCCCCCFLSMASCAIRHSKNLSNRRFTDFYFFNLNFAFNIWHLATQFDCVAMDQNV